MGDVVHARPAREKKTEFGTVKIDDDAAVLTLAEAIAHLERDSTLSPTRRRDLLSAVTRVAELIGADPQTTPASVPVLRPLINKVRPARHGLSKKTWSNVRSNFCSAIVSPAPRQRQHDPEWTRLRGLLPNAVARNGLCRFIGFCEDHDIPPAAVSDAVFDRFVADIEASANLSNPYHVHR